MQDGDEVHHRVTALDQLGQRRVLVHVGGQQVHVGECAHGVAVGGPAGGHAQPQFGLLAGQRFADGTADEAGAAQDQDSFQGRSLSGAGADASRGPMGLPRRDFSVGSGWPSWAA